jgi:hypothetical protein
MKYIVKKNYSDRILLARLCIYCVENYVLTLNYMSTNTSLMYILIKQKSNCYKYETVLLKTTILNCLFILLRLLTINSY